jgi:hypothetical protein
MAIKYQEYRFSHCKRDTKSTTRCLIPYNTGDGRVAIATHIETFYRLKNENVTRIMNFETLQRIINAFILIS